MEKQHELLRLIVQKMEIRTEADNNDTAEGDRHTPLSDMKTGQQLSSPVLKNKVTQSSIVSFWGAKKPSRQNSDPRI